MTPDHAVRELTGARPRLRGDLRFVFHDYRGRPSYVLEDLTHRRYFQIGLSEYQFIRNLDGRRTAREVLAQNAREFGERALSEQEAAVLLRWLLDQKLLETESADQSGRRYQLTETQAKKKPKAPLQQLFFLKLPLGNPDRYISAVMPLFSWMLSFPFFLCWAALGCYALFLLVQHWDPFVRASTAAILPQNWLILGVIYMALKLIHELWHGIMTKKFGGVVPEWGVQLLLFVTPLTYVDASASWRFPSRWHRIFVASAGMYIELFLASIAMIVWTQTEPGIINTAAHNTVFAASTITLLFNANPLMRFDGYYIFSDLIRIPNLAAKGQQFVVWLGKKIFFAMKDLPPPPSFLEQPVPIALYGVLAFIWRWIVWVGIMVLASVLFRGAGIILVALAVCGLVFGGLHKAGKYLFYGEGGRRPDLGRAFMRLALIALVIGLAGYFVPINPSPKAAAVIEYPNKAILRAECAGFVREVLCTNGQLVEKGQILAKLANPVKETELKQIAIDIQHSEMRRGHYFAEDRLTAYQAETENLTGLKERLLSTQALVDSLTVRAPLAGRVHGDRLSSMTGAYLQPGNPIVTVVPDEAPRVLLSVNASHKSALDQGINKPLALRLPGHLTSITAILQRQEERATTAVPHPALASIAGGPLLVRARPNVSSSREEGLAYMRQASDDLGHFAGLGAEDHTANLELTEARFAAYAILDDPKVTSALREGEWGYAKLKGANQKRLGVWMIEGITIWVRTQWEMVRG